MPEQSANVTLEAMTYDECARLNYTLRRGIASCRRTPILTQQRCESAYEQQQNNPTTTPTPVIGLFLKRRKRRSCLPRNALPGFYQIVMIRSCCWRSFSRFERSAASTAANTITP